MLRKKFIDRTFLIYFLSYLVLLTVMITGFFLIIRNQITERYFEQRSQQTVQQLNTIADQLNDDLTYLFQIDSSITTNINLILSRHTKEITYKYQTYQELKKYASSTRLISSIVYMPKNSREVLSTSLAVAYEQDVFEITTLNRKKIYFDPSPYFGASSGQLIFISDEDAQLLLYFPSTVKQADYLFFYILDTSNLLQQLENLSSAETPAIALIDADRRFVTGTDCLQLEPYVKDLPLEDGIYKIDSSSSLCVETGISSGFSIVALISNRSLLQQINASFASSYLALLLLSAVGFLVVLFAMRITYLPLHRLIKKIIPGSDSSQGYLEQLDYAFSETESQNQLLKEKLDSYRISMQKALLDSIVSSQEPGIAASFSMIDQLFDANSNKEIFAIQMSSARKIFPSAHIQRYFNEMLPGNDSCIILEARSDRAVFLINYTGDEQNKQDVLIELLQNFYEESGYLSAISNGTDSPMDIPSMYENVMRASSRWPTVPVVAFQSLPPEPAALTYPHEKLNRLSGLLTEHIFPTARLLIEDLFSVIGCAALPGNDLPDFFAHCVLLDLLTVIINSMNQDNIKFKSYSDLYFETLYYCRSCPYSEKAQEIAGNIGKLIDLYEREMSDKQENPAHTRQSKVVDPLIIRQYIEDSFCEPDLSITALANKFQISIAYASYLIKKECDQNFSDYLWTLRLKKARELLLTTDMSIDEISIAVGYLNTSSFRRKFKQETGDTPSRFRSGNEKPG